MGPKYEFTDETKSINGQLLHRIRRLSDGKIGGWVEKEENLSQEGNCWVADDSCVYSNAKIFGNAQVYDNARVCGNATVTDCAEVYNHAIVYGKAIISGYAQVYDKAYIYGNAKIYGRAKVYGNACVYDHTVISDDAQVFSNTRIFGEAKIYGYAQVFDYALISDNAKVHNNAKVYGYAEVYGNTEVCGDAEVYKNAKVCVNTSDDEEIIKDFIYKIDDSQKLKVQTNYESLDEFFSKPVTNDQKLDTLIICAVDTKEPIVKLQKTNVKNKTEFKFIVDITNEEGDNFSYKSTIKSQEHLAQLVEQTVEALRIYPQLSKYADDLENCL